MAVASKKTDDISPRPPGIFDFDVQLVLIVAALLAFGLLMVFSTTFDWSYLEYGSPMRIFLRQVRSALVGLVALVVAWRVDYRVLRNRNVALAIMLVTVLALLVLVALPTDTTQVLGASRSFVSGSIQPGEVAKLAIILYFAAWLASRRDKLHRIGYGLIPFTILVGLVGGLIVLQPDLSTAFIIVLTAGTMFFIAGANLLQVAVIASGAAFVGWTLATQFDYARNRLLEHVAAMQDLTQASWHVQQAVIAFTAPGSREGGTFTPNWFGVGLGQSNQKFGFLPAAHTDSIFAIIGEELGLFGCLFVLLLYGLFVWRAFIIAKDAPDFYGSILAIGIGAWIGLEAMMNIAVMTALIPFTGVPLPLISYGGSSLVVVLSAVGLLMNISRRRPMELIRIEDRGAPRADIDFSEASPRRKSAVRRVRRNR